MGHTSIKETIAGKRFINALDPRLLPDPPQQGHDFGTDYLIQVVEDNAPLRRLSAQVKYVDPDDVFWPFLDDELLVWEWPPLGLVTGNIKYVTHDLSLRLMANHYSHDIQRDIPVLFYMASQQDDEVFHLFLNDLDKYYLTWLPRAQRDKGTIRIYLNNVRSCRRSNLTSAFVPGDDGYDAAFHTYSMHDFVSQSSYITPFTLPDTVDSLCNLGVSLYLQNRRSKTRIIQDMNVGGFWSLLQAECESKPWMRILFSRFIGLLVPTQEMMSWAEDQLSQWRDVFSIPPALEILAADASSDATGQYAADICNRVTDGTWYIDYASLLDGDPGFAAENRFSAEYTIAIARFLTNRILHAEDAGAIDAMVRFSQGGGLHKHIGYASVRALALQKGQIGDRFRHVMSE